MPAVAEAPPESTANEVYDHEAAGTQHDLARLRDIESAGFKCRELKVAMDEAHTTYKAKKEIYQAAMERLLALSLERNDAPLFDEATRNESSIDHEAWRSTPIADLMLHGLKQAVVDALHAAGAKTLGDLASLADQGNPYTDIEGIGPAKAEAIENAMTAWFCANPTQRPAVKEAEVEEEASDAE